MLFIMVSLFTLSNLPFLGIIFFALLGVILTIYIHYKKSTNQPMVCPLNGKCEQVIHSEFSKFLGIPVELMGMVYYAITALAYILFMLLPAQDMALLMVAFFGISTSAFLFSVYLIFIQFFSLRMHCTWCLGSAGISMLIFFLALYASGDSAVLLMAQYADVFRSLYAIGIALGLGSATLAILFLGKFLRDLKISSWEADGLHTISQITWLALATLVICGFILYVSPNGTYSDKSFSLVQVIVLVILSGAGALLDLVITPRLVRISKEENMAVHTEELRRLRRFAFASGATVLISWYTSFLLTTSTPSGKDITVLTAYGITLFIGLLVSQFIANKIGTTPDSPPL